MISMCANKWALACLKGHKKLFVQKSYRLIYLVSRVLASDQGDLYSIPGRVPTQRYKMALDTSLLNTQQNKVRTKGKVE